MSDDVLNMSDEDFLNAPPPEEGDVPEAIEEPVDDSSEEEDTGIGEEEEIDSEASEELSEVSEEEESDYGLQEQGQEETNEVEKSTKQDTKPEEVDYKSFYDALTSPFKANGKEMKVDSIEDARQLMQMGANYNKKMAALKPHLKIVKTLEKSGINESELNYLLDLKNKNPEAIKKLLKDSDIDPLDIDISSDLNYTPKSHGISDKELELDNILSEIQDTDSFNKTIDVIGNKWDEKSKQVLVDQPQVIKVINDHVSNGIYDKIMSVVERERVLGRLSGLSDIEAYKQVGDALNAQGAFNGQPMGKGTQPNVKATNNKVDPNVASKRKAASATRSKPTVKRQGDFNPLSMSDEEFEKQFNSKFI